MTQRHSHLSPATLDTPIWLLENRGTLRAGCSRRRRIVATHNDYVAASNGQQFLANVRARDPNAPPINVVVNWLALLNR